MEAKPEKSATSGRLHFRITTPFIRKGWVESIEFRNFIITIKKALKPGHDKLDVRITAGNAVTMRKLK